MNELERIANLCVCVCAFIVIARCSCAYWAKVATWLTLHSQHTIGNSQEHFFHYAFDKHSHTDFFLQKNCRNEEKKLDLNQQGNKAIEWIWVGSRQ